MIVTRDLGKKFGDLWAVNGVDLRVEAGQVLALLGPNGAGKTTTVRLLTSVLRPSRGRAWVAGYDVERQPEQVRACVGVLTEHHGLYTRMPAEEYLDFFGQIYGVERSVRQRRIGQLLEQFGLGAERKRRISEFSKGMRQKLALVRALLHDPAVLLLDEPTSAMDPESARLVREAIRALRSASRTIIICTHNLPEAEALADQIAIISRGKIIAQGSPEALKSQWLGPLEYEVRLGSQVNGREVKLPPEVQLIAQGGDWLRFRTPNPAQANPLLLRALLEQGIAVLSLSEVPRSLEQVYLRAVNMAEEGGHV